MLALKILSRQRELILVAFIVRWWGGSRGADCEESEEDGEAAAE